MNNVSPKNTIEGMKGLLILGGLFFVMYFFVVLATIVSGKIFPTGTRNFYLLSSAVQSILLFGVPALLMYVMTFHSVWKSRLCLSKKASIADYFRAIIIFLVFIPGMDYVAKLNQQVHFPIASTPVNIHCNFTADCNAP